MVRPLAAALVLFVALPALADEVRLTTGVVLTGRIVAEDADSVSIRTDLGVMVVPKDRVAEVRKDEARPLPEPAPEGAARAAAAVWSRERVDVAVAPLAIGDAVVFASAEGGVVAVGTTDGRTLWSVPGDGSAVTGLAGDAAGVYVAHRSGTLSRLDARQGGVIWSTAVAAGLSGPPLVARPDVFVWAPGRGLVGVMAASGRPRGTLLAEFTPDTPIAFEEGVLLAADGEGCLAALSGDGTKPLAAHETGVPFHGRPLAFSMRQIVVAEGERLALIAPATLTVVRSFPVPGLAGHPLAADAARAYVEVSGVAVSVDLRTGRVLWRAEGAGRVLGLTPAATTVFAVTSEQRLVALRPGDGTVIFAADLPAAAAGAPVVAAGVTVVVTVDGLLTAFAETAGPAPATAPGAEEGRVFHSPDGYVLPLPPGFAVFETAIRGDASLVLRPTPGAPPFASPDLPEADRHLLSLGCEARFAVLPAEGEPSAEFREVPWPDAPEGEARRRFLRQIDAGRLLEVRFRFPESLRKVVEQEMLALLAVLRPEDAEWRPAPEVAVAEKVLAALSAGDLEATLPHLGEPAWQGPGAPRPRVGGVIYRVLSRDSAAAGRFRRVRVRIDSPESTRFADLLLGLSEGRWQVMDWAPLFR